MKVRQSSVIPRSSSEGRDNYTNRRCIVYILIMPEGTEVGPGVVLEQNHFWVSGRKWSSEYPDAGTFHSLADAKRTARQFGQNARVVSNYGYEGEKEYKP